jgi:xanthine/CO dehydrogenase XdhC/CoxF family maturation factor
VADHLTAKASCAVAHGHVPAPSQTRMLVTVFASPVADYLIRYGNDLGYRTILVEPERGRISSTEDTTATVLTHLPADLDKTADIVVTDHHRMELGPMLRDALALPVRWVGVLGNPRHPAPHIAALGDLGVPEADIARVHRPIGLNIGSRTPPEIAIAVLAGLLADRNGRPGGFEF